MPKCFGIVAGEKSGDILGAGLIKSLKLRFPDAHFVGVGGPEMLSEGCESIAAMDRLAVMGFVEPLGRLPELFRLKKALRDLMVERNVDAFIGIDSPDFNLRLASELNARGIRTVHYVSPSVWAYRKKRIHKIARAVDLMLTLFPFETEIYDEHGVPVCCVGHPLADKLASSDELTRLARQQFDLDPSDRVVALLPGSRGGEISRLGPVFLASAVASLALDPALRFLIPASGPESRARLETLLRSNGLVDGTPFKIVDDSQRAMRAADLVVLASGTATLEAMLLRRPMVVGYKLAPVTHFIASRLVKIPFVALPNLLAGRRLVPEYIQHDLTEEALVSEIMSFFSGADDTSQMLAAFDQIHASIRLNASERAADAIAGIIA
jgi:lipid-A-disaccharide synthase